MTGFGGGGGLFGDTCGALVGAMAALGAVYGRRDLPTDAKTAEEELYGTRPLSAVQSPAQRIQATPGSTRCRLLTAPGAKPGIAETTSDSASTWWWKPRDWPRRRRRPRTWPTGARPPLGLSIPD